MTHEIPLAGGNVNPGQVVRVGDTVRKPTRPGCESVHAVLLHLERVGFEHAPRFLGFDDKGREILSFIPGVNVWDSQHRIIRSPAGVATIGRLMRELHDALDTYTPPENAVWAARLRDPLGGDRLIHGDIGPWNLVAEPDSDQCHIIDWETVAPGRLVWELSYTLQTVAHLWHDPPPWTPEGFTEAETAARLRAFADGYGLDHASLVECVRFASERSQSMADWILAGAEAGQAAFVKMRDEKHPEAWASGALTIATNAERWIALVK